MSAVLWLPERSYLFDDDAPIVSGSGDSRQAPFVLDVQGRSDFVYWSQEIVRRSQVSQEAHWRWIGFDRIAPASSVFRLQIERIAGSGEQFSEKLISFYFTPELREIAADLSDALGQDCFNYRDMLVPRALSWVQQSAAPKDYEFQYPGLGFSVAYRAPAAIADLYIYDRQFPIINEDPFGHDLMREMSEASLELATTREDVKAWGESGTLESVLYSGFTIRDVYSLLLLGAARGRFIKLRLSFREPPFNVLFKEVVHEFVGYVSHIRERSASGV